MTVKQLRFGVAGQTFRHTPHVRAASATWELHDLMLSGTSDGYVVASGNATLDGVDTTVAAVAGPSTADPRALSVASAAGVVARTGPQDTEGGWYELATVGGEGELVRVVGVNGTDLELEWRLIRAYPAGSTLRGVTLTTATNTDVDAIAADANRADRYEPFRVVWTVNGRHHQDQVRVVRETDGDLDVAETIAFIRTIWPNVSVRIEHNNRDLLPDKVIAAHRMLASKERSQRIHPSQRLTGDQRLIAVAWSVLYTEAAQGNTPARPSDFGGETWLDHTRDHYHAAAGQILTGPGGADTANIDRATRAAEGTEDFQLRRTIGEL